MRFSGANFPKEPGVYCLQCPRGYYVGSAIDLHARRRTHESRHRRSSKKASGKLYEALDASDWAVWSLVCTTKSVHEARRVEQRIIEKHADDPKCLNTHRHTSIAKPHAKTTVWNGKIYPSILAAERESRFSAKAITKAIKRGLLSDADLEKPEIEWNGGKYLTFVDASKDSIYCDQTINRHYNLGKKSDEELMYSWNGERYKTAHEMLKHVSTDLHHLTIMKWYNRGARSDKELADMKNKQLNEARHKGREVFWNNVLHVSVSEAYRAWDNPKNQTITSFRKHLANGCKCDADVQYNNPGRPKKK